jgi:DNA-binding MarR family transcriptional regulator
MSFVLIRDIRDLAIQKLPHTIPAGHDILIDLAAANQLNRTLTMKQLLLTRGGSATTLRRHINLLIDAGYVVKVPNARDGRSDHFSVTALFLDTCAGLDEELEKLSGLFERRRAKRRTSDAATQKKVA